MCSVHTGEGGEDQLRKRGADNTSLIGLATAFKPAQKDFVSSCLSLSFLFEAHDNGLNNAPNDK